MKINEQSFIRFTPDKNLRWAKNAYLSSHFIETLSITKNHDLYEVNAIINDYYREEEVQLLIHDDVLEAASCTCRYHTNQNYCGHVAGLCLAINVLEPTSFPFKDNDAYKNKLQQLKEQAEQERQKIENEFNVRRSFEALELMSQGVKSNITQTLAKQEEVHLVAEVFHPQLTPERDYMSHYYENALSIRFKIGIDRFVILKNVVSFIERMVNGEEHRYGKYLAFKHDFEVFDSFSREVISLIQSAIPFRDRFRDGKELLLAGTLLDQFFDLYQDIDEGLVNLTFDVQETDMRISILALEEGFYLATLNEPVLTTSKYLYKYCDEVLTRFEHPQNTALIPIVTIIKDGDMARMNRVGLEKFLSILNSFNGCVEYTMDFDYEIASFEQLTNLYIDLEGDALLVKMACVYEDGSSINPFHETNVPVSIGIIGLKDYLLTLGSLVGDVIMLPMHIDTTEQFIHQDLEKIKNYCTVYISEAVKKMATPKPISIAIGVKTKNQLLEVDLSSFDFDIKELKDILLAYTKKKKYYQLKNGDVISLEQEAIEVVHETLEHLNLKTKDIGNGHLKLPMYRAFELDQINQTNAIRLERQKSFMQLVEGFKQQSKPKINPHYQNILRDYQRDGVEWLMKLSTYGFGGILADDMGLGKTLQIIAFLDSVTLKNHCLVVCPAVLLYNWQDEINKFSKDLSCVVVAGTQLQRTKTIRQLDKPTIIITTYDYMRMDVLLYDHLTFDYMIIDEAQYIKNHATKSSKAIKQVHALHKIALTGTPIENSLAELWSIFDYLMPGYLFDYTHFQRHFENNIIKRQNEVVKQRLKTMVEPFILRRTKKEVLKDLPDKIEQVLTFKFNQQEQNMYLSKIASIHDTLKQQLKMEKINKVAVFSMLTQLRQICCDVRLIDDVLFQPSSKLSGTMELIESLLESNKRILIFSAFTSMLELISIELKKKYIKHQILTGSVSKEKRKEMVDLFQQDQVPVFLISLKAGGVGLNLTNANAVIHYDPWWNLSAQNQATDRAYRIGQTQDVQVYKLIMKDSIEEKIIKMQERKQALSDVFVENSEGSIAKMDIESIMNLLNKDIEKTS